jgi:hypothetical protein
VDTATDLQSNRDDIRSIHSLDIRRNRLESSLRDDEDDKLMMKAHGDEEEREGVMGSRLNNGHHQRKQSVEPLATGASTAEKAGVILVSALSY